MDENELRIGNLVYRKDIGSGENRIEAIIEIGSKATVSGPIKVITNYDNLLGIPITQEWLVKMGFEKAYDDGVYDIGNTRIVRIIWAEEEPEWKIKRILGSDLTYYMHNMPAIKYVHQLQNLYFTLTGQELTIKP